MTEKISRILYGAEFREGWGPGPWQLEPDQVTWTEGPYRCEIHRQSILGHLCGYVSMARSHPAYKQRAEARDFDMHGGCTYSRREGNRWKIGFDCAHYLDLVPQIHFMRQPGGLFADIPGNAELNRDEIYRDIAFVEAEIHALVEQLEGMKKGPAGPREPGHGEFMRSMRAQRRRNIKWKASVFDDPPPKRSRKKKIK